MLIPSLNGAFAAPPRTSAALLWGLRRFGYRTRIAWGVLLAAADRLCRVWAARRLAREMLDWPDERLRDIGLTRGGIIAAVLGRVHPYRWRPEYDPSRLDRMRLGE